MNYREAFCLSNRKGKKNVGERRAQFRKKKRKQK
jgi:hypothetical protein